MPLQQTIDTVQVLSKPDEDHRLDGWHDIISLDHFWIARRQQLILKHFGDSLRDAAAIADVGCGRGVVTRDLGKKLNKSVDGFELNQRALTKSPPIRGTKYVYNFYDYNETLKAKFDLFLLLDVLEHVEDDVQFAKALAWHLKPGGKLLINVPSNQTLFSKYDEAAGHHRRYDSAHLTRVLTGAGYRVEKVVNWGYLYVPLLWIRKKMSAKIPMESVIEKGFNTSPFSNRLLAAWSRLDFNTRWKTPGTSLLLLAVKV